MNATAEISSIRPLLSQQQKRVLILIATGYNDRAIAHFLSISTGTLYGHIRAIKAKTGIRSRVLLAFYALGKGMVTQDEIRAAIRRAKETKA